MSQPATIPVTATNDQPCPSPAVSVIVALPDPRGLAIACVESLVRGQTYPRDRYEVIVVSDGTDLALESQVKAVLGPHDRLICHATLNFYSLYNFGARHAAGTLLFVTESHCVVEPQCLEQLMTFFATHEYDGACCRVVPISRNGLARMQGRLFDEGFRVWSQPGDWRKVNIRGFAIYRDLYLRVGGYATDLGRFADVALSAELHSQGRRLGYAAGATVRHGYLSSFRELFSFNREYVRGECTVRARLPVEYCERYFGYAEEWAQRGSFLPAVGRSMCRAGWRSVLRGGWSMVAAQTKALCRSLPVSLFGPRARLVRYRCALWRAIARCWVWRFYDERLYRAYRDVYDLMIRVSRLEFIAESLAAPPPVPPAAYELRLGEMDDEWLVGFHLVERWGNEAFRWSGPVGLIRLGVPQGTYEVRLETRGVRQASIWLSLGVFFNRHRLPPAALWWQDGRLTFRLDSSMFAEGPEQHLVLTCNPLRPWTVGVPDRRELGLPIFSIGFRSIGETESEATNDHRQPSVI